MQFSGSSRHCQIGVAGRLAFGCYLKARKNGFLRVTSLPSSAAVRAAARTNALV